jgi:hypothetical protein
VGLAESRCSWSWCWAGMEAAVGSTTPFSQPTSQHEARTEPLQKRRAHFRSRITTLVIWPHEMGDVEELVRRTGTSTTRINSFKREFYPFQLWLKIRGSSPLDWLRLRGSRYASCARRPVTVSKPQSRYCPCQAIYKQINAITAVHPGRKFLNTILR